MSARSRGTSSDGGGGVRGPRSALTRWPSSGRSAGRPGSPFSMSPRTSRPVTARARSSASGALRGEEPWRGPPSRRARPRRRAHASGACPRGYRRDRLRANRRRWPTILTAIAGTARIAGRPLRRGVSHDEVGARRAHLRRSSGERRTSASSAPWTPSSRPSAAA